MGPMKHYRIVKKSTHILIAISAFAIFFNGLLFGAISVGFLKLSDPTPAKAACDASVPPANASFNSEAVARKIYVDLTKTDINNKIGYNIIVTKKCTSYDGLGCQDSRIDHIFGSSDPGMEGFNPRTVEIPILDAGTYLVEVSFQNLTDPSCIYTTNSTQQRTFVFSPTDVSTGTIELYAEPTILNLKNANGSLVSPTPSTKISYKFTGHTGDKYHLWITDCAGEPQDKFGGLAQAITTDPAPSSDFYTVTWSPQETACNEHTVRIKTFNGLGIQSGKKEISIGILGSEGQTASDPENPAEESDELTTPAEVSLVSHFPGGFKLPKTLGGAGDIVALLIVLFEYLLGVAAFIGIVISGIQYISSGGDSAKAEKAKKTLLYCVIGIIIATLALTLQGFMAKFWEGPK